MHQTIMVRETDRAVVRAQRWDELERSYPRCPDEDRPALDPQAIATEVWRRHVLPKPRPYIAPGWGITGKYAYLETRGQLRDTFTSDTPLGAIQINATGRYSVDWGDGTKTGPYDFEGTSWPDGQITHTYIHVGTYDIVLTEEWTAIWHFGPNGGQLSGQRTTGTIENFRVEQIQVVVGQ